MNNIESSQLILNTFESNYHNLSSTNILYTWYNLNFDNILNSIYNKYDEFNIVLNSVVVYDSILLLGNELFYYPFNRNIFNYASGFPIEDATFQSTNNNIQVYEDNAPNSMSSIRLDATINGYVLMKTGDIISSNGLSFSLWIYIKEPSGNSQTTRIFNISGLTIDGSNARIDFYVRIIEDQNLVRFEYDNVTISGTTYGSAYPYVNNTWIHYSFTMDPSVGGNGYNSTWNHYINGVFQDFNYRDYVPSFKIDMNDFSYYAPTPTVEFDGYIRDFRFYNDKVLTAEEVTKIYNFNYTGINYSLKLSGLYFNCGTYDQAQNQNLVSSNIGLISGKNFIIQPQIKYNGVSFKKLSSNVSLTIELNKLLPSTDILNNSLIFYFNIYPKIKYISYNNNMNIKCSNLVLKTGDLTAGGSTKLGTMDANRTSMTWNNVSLKNILNEMYNEYDNFNLCLNTVAWNNISTISTITSQYINGISSIAGDYNVKEGINDTWNYISTSNFIASTNGVNNIYGNCITFNKNREIINISIQHRTVDTNTIPVLASTLPDCIFYFNIYGVN